MPTDPLFYLIGLPAIFLIGLGRGAFGGGLAILGVPLLALVIDPVTATFMMAPIVSASDPFTVWAFPPRTWSMPDLKWLVPGVVVGLCFGALFVSQVDPRIVTLGIALVILWFTLRYFMRDRAAPIAHTEVNPPLMPAVPLGVWAGKRLHDRLDEKRLYFWCYALVGVAGLRLLIDSAWKIARVTVRSAFALTP